MTDLLIDANAVYARAFYALEGNPQETVRAALVTVLTLLNVNAGKLDLPVDRLLFAWDGEHKRDKGRAPKPAAYHATRDFFKESVTLLFNPAHGYSDTHEADDVLATAVQASTAEAVIVASVDKDLRQLHGGKVQYYCLHEKCLLSARMIVGKYGIKRPSQIAIALAIIGDKVDGISGVKGWGHKRVAQLFKAVSPDMNFAEALEAVTSQIPEQLLEKFYAGLELTLLDSNVPGIPEPALVEIADLDVAEQLCLPDFMDHYRPVYRHYRSRTQALDEDEESVPKEY